MVKKHTFIPVTPGISFPDMEKRLLADWYKRGLVKKYLHRNDASKKRFSFLDGPITANNPMGVHHAWGRTYKDLWQRFYTLRGYKERFQNGFDCQGLWVEVEVEKELKLRTKKDIENLVAGDTQASIAKFVELCKERVRKYSTIQSEQSKRLGYIVDWDNSYYTMSDENNYMIWYFLKTCYEKGWIYKGKDSVPWCPRCETAISQHEMLTEDYKEITHKSVYMEFPINDREKEYLLVWTTTPWTIPANIAVAVDKDLDYSMVEGNTGNMFWIVKERVEAVFGKEYKRIVKTVKGKELVGLRYKAPFDDLEAVTKLASENPKTFHTVVATDPLLLPVTTTEGTGLVHTAVSAGAEDFKLGKKYGLPMLPVIADNADYLPHMGFLAGKNAKKHPELILDYMEALTAEGKLCVFKIENYMHRYPACWRCKTELVWKVADEWYIAMDVKEKSTGKTLRQQMMDTAKQITWKPSFGLDRELDWLSNMHDWLISKPNRYWGLALPIYECNKCGFFTVIGSKEELKQKAVKGWKQFEGHSPHKPYIDEVKIRCEKCGETVSRLTDVGNVWLDAGIVGFSTLIDPQTKKLSYTTDKKYWGQWYPANFITESFPGQFKNWFYSMIAMSTVLEKKTCFKTVLGYASMLGEDGRPMHKSLGNAIEFNEAADKIGADVMRWMFVKHNPEQNLLFGYKLADETRRKFHLLLWNVYNFFVTYANVDGWSPVTKKKNHATNILDVWILSKLYTLIAGVTKSLEAYDVATAANSIESFVTDLSQWYVRRSRNRVGPTAEDSIDKLACYSTLYNILVTLSVLIAPFTPFLSEEMYTNLTDEESVHLADWPEGGEVDAGLEKAMDDGRMVSSVLLAFRKQANVKVRIPFKKLSYRGPRELTGDIKKLVLAEANVYELIYEGINEPSMENYSAGGQSDVKNQDIEAGKVRDVIREIQVLRKEKGCKIDELVQAQLPVSYKELPKKLQEYIKKETLVTSITWGDTLQILIG